MLKRAKATVTESGEDLKKWASQIRKGSLEMCLLAAIARRPCYGFDIMQELRDLLTSEGTLYPLLNRLQNEGAIDAYWQESASGPPRKYYTLTETGRETLAHMQIEWQRYTSAVEAVLTATAEVSDDSQPGERLIVRAKPAP
jgi:PadR family transcriptional regulator PadR